MKTRPPLDILVWCHLPSWAIWSPSLRPQFSPARLSGLRTRDNYQKVPIRISTSISILNLQFVIKRKMFNYVAFWSLAYHLISAHLDFISLQYGVASIGIWKWEFCTFKKEVSHWMVHGYHGCYYILRGFHCEWKKKTEGKWYFSSSPSSSYWRMGPELTRLAGVPISLGLAEDRLDANLQELVIRPPSY